MAENYKKIKSRIFEITEPIVNSFKCELLGIELLSDRGNLILRIYIDYLDWEIDSNSKINLNICENISREISAVLDVEDPIPGRYILEVSSPGIDRLLFKPEHFKKAIGKKIKVKTEEKMENRHNFLGILNEVKKDSILILIEENNNKFEIPFAKIKKANLKL